MPRTHERNQTGPGQMRGWSEYWLDKLLRDCDLDTINVHYCYTAITCKLTKYTSLYFCQFMINFECISFNCTTSLMTYDTLTNASQSSGFVIFLFCCLLCNEFLLWSCSWVESGNTEQKIIIICMYTSTIKDRSQFALAIYHQIETWLWAINESIQIWPFHCGHLYYYL